MFERLLTDTCAGAPQSLFLTGEPGIRKTHLFAELARRAEGLGCLVLEGRAAEFEQELPFGVVIDALDAYVESLEPRSVDRLAADGLEELAEVFPSLRSLRSTMWSPSTAGERLRAYYAVRDLLERLAAKQVPRSCAAPVRFPNPGGHSLGAQAGPERLGQILAEAGLSRCRATVATPFNLVLEARP